MNVVLEILGWLAMLVTLWGAWKNHSGSLLVSYRIWLFSNSMWLFKYAWLHDWALAMNFFVLMIFILKNYWMEWGMKMEHFRWRW